MERSLMCAGLLAATLGSAAPARAQGSSVMSHSACTVAMGISGVAAPCADGSAILFSPAAMVLQPSVVSIGSSAITTSGSFTYDDTGTQVESPDRTTPVPYGYLSYRLNDRWAAGIGVFAPYGLRIGWPETFEGRFVSYETDLKNIYVQPTVAYRVDDVLSLGAGVDVVRGSIEINRHLDLATTAVPGQPFTFGQLGIPRGTDFARMKLSGDGTGMGYHLGAILHLTDKWSLGLRYLSKVDVKLSGTADFTQLNTGIVLPAGNPLNPATPVPLDAVLGSAFQEGGAVSDQDVSTTLTLPAQIVAGVAYEPIQSLKLAADFQWTGWSVWDQYPLDFESAPDQLLVLDYQDTQTYHLGAEWIPIAPLALRAGYMFSTAAERPFSVSPLLPEAERDYYSAGLGFRFTPALRLDVGYQLVEQADRRGRVLEREAGLSSAELQALNVGVYSANAHVFTASLVYQFGSQR